jgi:hypothetical protein
MREPQCPRLRSTWIAAAVFAMTVGLLLSGAVDPGVLRWKWRPLSPEGYLAQSARRSGSGVVLVFIGSPECPWSTLPSLPGMIRDLKLGIRERAAASDRWFATIGIAQSSDARSGMAFLESFGEFDEVVAGGGWTNVGLLRYVYGNVSGLAATPQVVVVERVARPGDPLEFLEERLLARYVGIEHIERWLATGAALPALRDL